MRWSLTLSTAALAVSIAAPAFAAGVTVSDGWFRALPAGLPAGGYMTLHNSGDSEAVLTGATSPACGMVMLHKSSDMGGMSRMEMVEKVAVPAHGSVSFKPGSYHLMCMKPVADRMAVGSTVEVTLQFADGTTTSASFRVLNARGG